MVQWVVSAVETSVKTRNTTPSEFSATSSEVMQLTGPAAWTDAVFRQLQQYNSDLFSLRDLSGLSKPLLVGDILILPIDGIGMGQFHSNSTHDGSRGGIGEA
jgi:alpha 1,6-mannosyltransferase